MQKFNSFEKMLEKAEKMLEKAEYITLNPEKTLYKFWCGGNLKYEIRVVDAL